MNDGYKCAESILQNKFDKMQAEMERKSDAKIKMLEDQIQQKALKDGKGSLISHPANLSASNEVIKGLTDSLKGKNSSISLASLPFNHKDFTGDNSIFNTSAVNITRDVGNFGSDYRLAQTPAVERIPTFDVFNSSGVSLVPVMGTNSPYVDEVTDGDAEPQENEGDTKANIDVEYVETVVATKTYAATMRVSDQMLEDLPALQQWLNSILRRKLQYKYNADFFTGSGSTGETESLETLSTELVLTNYVTNLGVAGIGDVINAGLTQVHLNNFQPDSIFMNPIDYYKMMAERASDEHYINGVATFRNYLVDNPFVARIWLTNYVAQNTMYINEIGLVNTIYKSNMFGAPELGFNGEDFSQNMMTVRAHVRLENICPTNHRGGLIKISDIDAAITAIAGTPA